MKKFSERDPVRIGVVGVLIVALVLGLALNVGALQGLLGGSSHRAVFSEAGGLKAGDEVRVGGMAVGRVDSVELAGPGVLVGFTVSDDAVSLGRETSAAISVATILGEKFLELTPRGEGSLDGPIPLARTEAPYDLPEVLSTLTDKAGEIDVDRVATALDTVSATLERSTPELRAAVEGVSRLSATIESRDEALTRLLERAESVSGVLAERSQQLRLLVADGNLLLRELQRRRDTIRQLLVNVSALSEQLTALVADNREQLAPTLQRLNSVLALLQRNEQDLSKTISGLARYPTVLGEAVSHGPFFTAYIPNLVPPGNLVPLSDFLPQLAPPPAADQPKGGPR